MRREIVVRIDWPNIPLESLCAEVKSVLIQQDFKVESVESGENEPAITTRSLDQILQTSGVRT
jgi:hypothetical protein